HPPARPGREPVAFRALPRPGRVREAREDAAHRGRRVRRMSAAAATRRATGRKSTADTVLEGAVELARAALGDEPVGEHLGFTLEAERLGTHYFAATAPGYTGWRWYVTLSRIPRSRNATVCESGLLPGDESLLAPAWLPWAERL